MNYKRLPRGYRLFETIDFVRSRRQLLIVNGLSLALAAATIFFGALYSPMDVVWRNYLDAWWILPITALLQVLYILAHELTHGVAMFALTGVKPKYGVKPPYAYCGSTAWLDKRSHDNTALLPAVVWGVVFGVLVQRVPSLWYWPIWTLQISNISGSAGDFYCVVHTFRMPKKILVQDTGVRMRVFAPIEKQ